MIARLRGMVDVAAHEGTGLIVDVAGVGYLVQVSTRSRARLPSAGEAATLLIETHLREDSITLYGFVEPTERDWFRWLTTVQGVGGKVALNILSALEPDALAAAIRAGDKASLARAEGVGPKLAARLATELKDKAAALGAPAAASPAIGAKPDPAPARSGVADAVSALVNLGYRPADAQLAIAGALRRLGEGAAVPELIRLGLADLGRLGEAAR